MLNWAEKGIYAGSFFVYDDEDDPRRPTCTLGYNTEDCVKEEMEDCDELEARWNYACWLQNEELIFGEGEESALIQAWIKENRLFDCDTYNDDDQGCKITEAFVNILVDVVRDLHESGFIKKIFGKEIPILIHELEYYDEIVEQNVRANGEKLCEGLRSFVESI